MIEKKARGRPKKLKPVEFGPFHQLIDHEKKEGGANKGSKSIPSSYAPSSGRQGGSDSGTERGKSWQTPKDGSLQHANYPTSNKNASIQNCEIYNFYWKVRVKPNS